MWRRLLTFLCLLLLLGSACTHAKGHGITYWSLLQHKSLRLKIVYPDGVEVEGEYGTDSDPAVQLAREVSKLAEKVGGP